MCGIRESCIFQESSVSALSHINVLTNGDSQRVPKSGGGGWHYKKMEIPSLCEIALWSGKIKKS